jgi:hypothetical protein
MDEPNREHRKTGARQNAVRYGHLMRMSAGEAVISFNLTPNDTERKGPNRLIDLTLWILISFKDVSVKSLDSDLDSERAPRR